MPKKVDNKPLPNRTKGNTGVFEIHPELIRRTVKSDATAIVDPTELQTGNKQYFFRTMGLSNNFTVALKEGITTVGREGCDILVINKSVSSKHCTLRLKEGILSVVDNGSTNGTYISGQKIKPDKTIILEPNDTILLGQMLAEILLEDPIVVEEQQKVLEAERSGTSETTRLGVRMDLISELDRLHDEQTHEGKKKEKEEKRKQRKELEWESTGVRFAGGILRFLALIADISLSFTIFSFLQSEPVGMEFLGQLTALADEQLTALLTDPMGQSILLQIKPFLSFIVLYLVYRVTSTLVFGVTLSQFLIGIRTQQGFLHARLGGIFRELIGFVTLPFIIFDVPALLHWKTLKELLTGTRLGRATVLTTTMGVVVFCPILLASGLVAPLLQQGVDNRFLLENGITVTRMVSKKSQAKEAESSQQRIHSSDLFLTYEKDPALQMFASFTMENINAGKRIRPLLKFVNTNEQIGSSLALIKNVSLFDLLNKIGDYDPLFSSNHPAIWNFIEKERIGENVLRVDGQNNQVVRRTVALDLENFITASFGLGLNNILQHVQENGPFLFGSTSFRNDLLKIIDLGDRVDVEFEDVAGATFMKVVSYENPRQFQVRLIPMGIHPMPVFEYLLDRNDKMGIIDLKKNMKSVFEKITWNFNNPTRKEFPEIDPSKELSMVFNEFNIVDFFLGDGLNPLQLETLDMYSFSYLFTLARQGLESEDDQFLFAEIEKILNRYKTVLNALVMKDPTRSKLKEKLDNLILAYRNKDRSHFVPIEAGTQSKENAMSKELAPIIEDRDHMINKVLEEVDQQVKVPQKKTINRKKK